MKKLVLIGLLIFAMMLVPYASAAPVRNAANFSNASDVSAYGVESVTPGDYPTMIQVTKNPKPGQMIQMVVNMTIYWNSTKDDRNGCFNGTNYFFPDNATNMTETLSRITLTDGIKTWQAITLNKTSNTNYYNSIRFYNVTGFCNVTDQTPKVLNMTFYLEPYSTTDQTTSGQGTGTITETWSVTAPWTAMNITDANLTVVVLNYDLWHDRSSISGIYVDDVARTYGTNLTGLWAIANLNQTQSVQHTLKSVYKVLTSPSGGDTPSHVVTQPQPLATLPIGDNVPTQQVALIMIIIAVLLTAFTAVVGIYYWDKHR